MKSYLRFLSRNKLYAIIEAFGLAFALGFVILLVSYAKAEFSTGRNIKDADKIYLLGTGDMFGMTLDTPVAIAIPICVKAMRYYLQDFYYQIDFPWWVILLSACITILIVILSILGQTVRIATKNPIDGIRTE